MAAHGPIREIFRRLIEQYRVAAPEFTALELSMRADGVIAQPDQLAGDHIALRTLGAPHLGIASLEPLLIHHGYMRKDAYHFSAKHLDAYWYSPPDDDLPRLFISELRIADVSSAAGQTLRSYTDAIVDAPLAGVNLDDSAAVANALQSRPWRMPTAADYRTLLAESEYAAWTLVNSYLINHVTLSVHALRADLRSVAALNVYLEAQGLILNAFGGKVKTSPDGLLLQSSTVAQTRSVTFADGGIARVAGPYIEFAERRALPKFVHVPESELGREHRRDGFEAANADRIFESTDLTTES